MQITIPSVLFAFVAAATGTIRSNLFSNYGGVDLKFASEHVTTGVRSRLYCVALCGQHPSSCLAGSWDQGTKTCQEFTRTLLPETTPHFTFSTDNAMFIGHGYTYIAGMLIKFVTTPKSWDSAQNHCVHEGGRLLVLDTLEKYQAIHGFMEKDLYLKESIWNVGGTKINGVWTLTTGEALDPGMSVQSDQGVSCLGFYDSLLNDNSCWYHTNFICEK